MAESPRFLYTGASVSLAIRVGGVGILFLANIILAQTMPQHDYGLFAYAVELVAVAAVIAVLGLDQIAISAVPDALAQDNRSALLRFGLVGLATALGMSSAIVILLQVARQAEALPATFDSQLVGLVGCSIAALAFLRFSQELARGARRIALSQAVEQIGWPSVLLAIAATAWIATQRVTVELLLMTQAALYLVATGVLFTIILKLARNAGPNPVAADPRKWFSTGIPLALAASLSILLNRGDILALGTSVDPAELAYYTAASRYAALLVLGLAAVSAAGAAPMRDAWRSGDRQELQSAVGRAAGVSLLFAVPVGAAFLVFPELALSLYGPGFTQGATVLRILTVAQMLNAVTGPVALIVIVCDLGRPYTLSMALSTGLLAILLLALIPRYGTTGAAIATCIALSILNISLATVIWRRIGIRAWATPTAVAAVLNDVGKLVLKR